MLIAVIISFPFAAEIVLESYEILLPGTLTEAALLASIVAATPLTVIDSITFCCAPVSISSNLE